MNVFCFEKKKNFYIISLGKEAYSYSEQFFTHSVLYVMLIDLLASSNIYKFCARNVHGMCTHFFSNSLRQTTI